MPSRDGRDGVKDSTTFRSSRIRIRITTWVLPTHCSARSTCEARDNVALPITSLTEPTCPRLSLDPATVSSPYAHALPSKLASVPTTVCNG